MILSLNKKTSSLSFQTELGTAIFEQISNVCYDMLDHRKSYERFLVAMKLLHVPVHAPRNKTDPGQFKAATAGRFFNGCRSLLSGHRSILCNNPSSLTREKCQWSPYNKLWISWRVSSRLRRVGGLLFSEFTLHFWSVYINYKQRFFVLHLVIKV